MESGGQVGSGGQVQVWRADGFRVMPWRNGGGVSHEIATWPPHAGLADFDWRISLADVAAGRPFSQFEGVDRVIVLLEGTSMLLRVDGRPHRLGPAEPLRFSGDSTTTCELPDGPTRDLNVMTRRGRVTCAVAVLEPVGPVEVAGAQEGEVVVLFVLAGRAMVAKDDAPPVTLGRHDAGQVGGPGRLSLTGPARVVVIRLDSNTARHRAT